jgi:hypothetical protein
LELWWVHGCCGDENNKIIIELANAGAMVSGFVLGGASSSCVGRAWKGNNGEEE